MKKYLIIGGTGTLGKAMTKELLKKKDIQIRILSRCELKQKQMAKEFNNDKRITYILGDIRDRDTTFRNLAHSDVVFHFAALKHVDSMEENPEECVKTNIHGTINVADAAQSCGVKHVIFSSTDKAPYAVNVYGSCKYISERIFFRRNVLQKDTKFSIYRWGNVIGSRGSVIPTWIDSFKNNQSIEFTDPDMSRFWIRIERAVAFILDTYEKAPLDEVMIPDIKAASVKRVAQTIGKLMGENKINFNTTGIRPGERMSECLRSEEEGGAMYSHEAPQFTDKELMHLLRPIVEECV